MTPEPVPPRVKWKYELDGEGPELRALAKMFDAGLPGGRIRVWFENGRYYLNDRDFEETDDFEAVRARGDILVRRLNGLGFLKFNGFRPVSTGNLYRIAPDGGQGVMAIARSGFLSVPTRQLTAYLDHTPDCPPVTSATRVPIVDALPPAEHATARASRPVARSRPRCVGRQ